MLHHSPGRSDRMLHRGVSRRAVVAGALPLGALLAACGAGAGQAGGGSAPQQPEISGRIVHWSIAMFPFTEDVGLNLANEFRARYPKVEYVPETVVGDRVQKLIAAAAADTAPDIGMSTPFQVQELGVNGISLPLEGFLKSSRVVTQKDLWPTLLYDMTYKGKQYGMPFAPDVRVMYVNKAALLSAGIDPQQPARTWDELEQHINRMYRVTAKSGKPLLGFPPFWGSGGNALWLLPFWQLGGELLSKDGEKVLIDSEPGIKALEWLKHLHEIQGGWDAINERKKEAPSSNAHFINGTMGYYFATFTERKSKEFLASPDLEFGFTPWPLPANGRHTNYGGNHTFLLTTQSKNQVTAWKFLEFLAEPNSVLKFATRYDRIPVRMDVAKSQDYQQHDPFLKLAVDEMGVRRFQIPAPGGGDIQKLHNQLSQEAVSGSRPAREVLSDYASQMQQILDKFKR